MEINILNDANALGKAAAGKAAQLIKKVMVEEGMVNIILATGSSQFLMLEQLIREDIDWAKVTAFHLDEYVGMNESHQASFRNYLKKRFVEKISGLKEFVYVDGDAPDIAEECQRLSKRIAQHPIHVAMVGIGENGHLAFNDPPADFSTEKAYFEVELDEACRAQQFNEGWFSTMEDVPARAISMGIQQILKSRHLIVSVPDARKAEAVKNAIEGPVTNMCPSSILQTHKHCSIFLDRDSASLLKTQTSTVK